MSKFYESQQRRLTSIRSELESIYYWAKCAGHSSDEVNRKIIAAEKELGADKLTAYNRGYLQACKDHKRQDIYNNHLEYRILFRGEFINPKTDWPTDYIPGEFDGAESHHFWKGTDKIWF